MWEIKKQYDNKQFPNTKASVGYKIDVYQESINKVFSEYLVNYEYLTTVMEDFGFASGIKQKKQKQWVYPVQWGILMSFSI